VWQYSRSVQQDYFTPARDRNFIAFLLGNIYRNPMTTFTPHRLGQIIKAYRLEQKLTQAQLAAKSGTGLRFIVELERGKPTVQLGKVIAVADALGLMLMLQKDVRAKIAQPTELNLVMLAKIPQSAKLALSHTEIAPNVLESAEETKLLREAIAKKQIADTIASSRQKINALREHVGMTVRDAKIRITAKNE
jgi:HTH-type transcriptional regulator / antitoxin HipB